MANRYEGERAWVCKNILPEYRLDMPATLQRLRISFQERIRNKPSIGDLIKLGSKPKKVDKGKQRAVSPVEQGGVNEAELYSVPVIPDFADWGYLGACDGRVVGKHRPGVESSKTGRGSLEWEFFNGIMSEGDSDAGGLGGMEGQKEYEMMLTHPWHFREEDGEDGVANKRGRMVTGLGKWELVRNGIKKAERGEWVSHGTHRVAEKENKEGGVNIASLKNFSNTDNTPTKETTPSGHSDAAITNERQKLDTRLQAYDTGRRGSLSLEELYRGDWDFSKHFMSSPGSSSSLVRSNSTGNSYARVRPADIPRLDARTLRGDTPIPMITRVDPLGSVYHCGEHPNGETASTSGSGDMIRSADVSNEAAPPLPRSKRVNPPVYTYDKGKAPNGNTPASSGSGSESTITPAEAWNAAAYRPPIHDSTVTSTDVEIEATKSSSGSESTIKSKDIGRPSPNSGSKPRTPTTLTWNDALSRLLNSGCVDADMIEAVIDRISESTSTNHNEHSTISAVDLGLVPDFSRPIGWGSFYDRYADAGIITEDLYSSSSPDSPDIDSLCIATPLLNGVSRSRSSGRSRSPNLSPTLHTWPRSHSRPTGLPPLHLPKGFSNPTLLPPDSPSPPLSPTSASLLQESTLATQNQLIHDLHTIIDDLRTRNQNLEERTLPQLESLVERQVVRIEELEALVGALDEEVGDLRALLDWCGGLLGRAWERKEEVVGWCDGVKKMRSEARTSLRRALKVFRRRDTWGSVLEKVRRSVSSRSRSRDAPAAEIRLENLGSGADLQNEVLGRTELGDVAWLAERNLRMLRDDIEGMAELVMDFMNKYQGVEC